MDNLRGISTRWPSRVAEKFVPTSYWTEDADGNYFLHLHLPGFKSEEVRIELLPSADQIKIGGERIVNDKCIYIDQTFSLPENSNVDDIVGKFEDEHLQITVPKKPAEENEEHNSENETWNSTAEESAQEESNLNGENKKNQEQCNDDHEHKKKKERNRDKTSGVSGFPEDLIKKWEGKENPLEMIIKWIKRNKGIVLSVVLSFAVGVWVSTVWIKLG